MRLMRQTLNTHYNFIILVYDALIFTMAFTWKIFYDTTTRLYTSNQSKLFIYT